MLINILLWSSAILSFIGYFFINRKDIKGLKIFLISNILTIIFDIITNNWIQAIMFGVFVYFNIDGIIKWSKEERKKQ